MDMPIKFVGVDEVLCNVDKLLYCDRNEADSLGVVKLVVVFKLDGDTKKLYEGYCKLSREVRQLWKEEHKLEERIVRKHGGEWKGTYVDGRVIVRKGWFRPRSVEVWDDELSPKLATVIREEHKKRERLNEIRKILKERILKKLNESIGK